MKISELQPRQGRVELEADVVHKGDVREFSKFGKTGKVCDAKLKDETGEIKMTLWNEQADQIQLGDRVKISNGYVGEWQGEKQLSTGKFGTLEVLSGDNSKEPSASEEPKQEDPKEPEESSEDQSAVEEEVV